MVKGGFILLINYLFVAVLGIIYTIFVARLLGPKGYGIFATGLALFNVLWLVAALGIPPATARYVSKYLTLKNPKAVKGILKISLKYILMSALAFSAVLAAIAGPIATYLYHDPGLVNVFRVVALMLPPGAILLWLLGAFQGFQQMRYYLFTETSFVTFRLPIAIIFIALGYFATGALMGAAVGLLLACIIGSFLLFLKVQYGSLGGAIEGKKLSEELKSFSTPAWITALSMMLVMNYGILLLGNITSMREVGYYSSAFFIAFFLQYLPRTAEVLLLPLTTELWTSQDKKGLASVIRTSLKIIFVLLVPPVVGMAIFSEFILTLVYGGEFVAGANVLRILLLSLLFMSIRWVNAPILGGLGREDLNAKIHLLGAAFTILVTTPLIWRYGIIGAAIGLLLALAFIACLETFFVLKVTGLAYPFEVFIKPVPATVVMLLSIVLLRSIATNALQAIIVGIIGLLIYAITFLLFKGIEEKDVEILRAISVDMGEPVALKRIVNFLWRFVDKKKK
jgi:O-antigen/teichoic acid export membrane protein